VSLNIKNETVHGLVRELAARTGVSQTSAVEDAVRRRLAELDASGPDPEVERDLEAIAEAARAIRASVSEEDLEWIRHADEWLYDENGLPK